MNKLNGILTLSVLLLCSCSSMSSIEKESESESHFKNAVYGGKDFYIAENEVKGERYRVFHQASTGFSGTSGIRQSATQRANDYCRKKDSSKKMFTVSEHTASPPYILGNFPRIEIIFVCVDAEDKKGSVHQVSDKYDRLNKIKNLLEAGTLTQEEFKKEKEKILSER